MTEPRDPGTPGDPGEPAPPPAATPLPGRERQRRGLLRRLARALVVSAGLLVAVLVLAILATQTTWFKDWLRRYVTRQAQQVLDAELTIRRIDGNLFFGIELDDVVLAREGKRVVALDRVRASYSVFDFISRRWVVQELELGRPVILATRTADGWNVARLLKPRKPGGGGAPTVTIGTLRMHDASVIVERPAPARPTRVDDIDLVMGVSLDRTGFSLAVEHLSLQLADPALRVGHVAGTFTRRGPIVTIARSRVDLPQSHVTVDGTVRTDGEAPALDLAVASGALAFREVGLFVPAIARIPLAPAFQARVTGPVDRLLVDLDLRSRAGDAGGRVTVVPTGEARGVEGTLDLVRVDPAVWSQTPALAGTATGRSTFAISFANAARGRPAAGWFTFAGPEAAAAGYAASDLTVRGAFRGSRVTLERVSARAYGGAVTTRGTIEPVPGPQPGVQYALAGDLRGIDLRRLPPSLPIPDLDSAIAAAYDVKGAGSRFTATVTLEDSRIEGARFEAGTTGYLELDGRRIRYGGTGRLADLNLPRFGEALELAALTDARLDGSLRGGFALTAEGRGARELALDATLDLESSTITGMRLPAMKVVATLAEGRLQADLDGAFEGLDLARALDRPALASSLDGRLDGRFTIADVTEGLAIEGLAFDGRVVLGESTLFGRRLTAADVTGGFSGRTVRAASLTASGPLGTIKGAGTLALGDTGSSDFAYTLEGVPLDELRETIGRVEGTLDTTGRVTGNGTALVATGDARVAELVVAPPAEGNEGRPAVTATDSTASYVVTLPDLEPARVRAQADVAMSLAAVAGQAVDRASGRIAYAERALTFDIGATAGERNATAAGRVDFEDGVRRVALDRLSVAANGLDWVLAPEAGPRIAIRADTVEVRDLRLASGDQRADFSGVIAVGPGGASAFDVSVRGLPLDQIPRVIGREGMPLRGVMNAVARVTGTRAQPEVLGSFAVERGAYRELTFERLAGAVHYDANRVGIDALIEQQPGAVLSMNGSVPWALFAGESSKEGGGEPIDLWVQSSTIGLGIVTGLTSAVSQVEGTLRVNLHITGPAENPLFDGGLAVEQGAFTVPLLGRRYTGLTSTFRFEPGRMQIDALRLLDDSGDPLTVTGEVGLRQLALGQMLLKASGRQFGIVRNALGTVDLDLDLEAYGPITRPKVVGVAAVHTGRIEVDEVLARLDGGGATVEAADDSVPTIGMGQRPAEPAPAKPPAAEPGPAAAPGAPRVVEPDDEEKASWFSRLAMDVRVRIPDNLILRGRDVRTSATSLGLGNVNVTVGGDFRIRKEPPTPVALVGNVTTVRGSYDFRGRRFEILRDGRIQFVGGTPIDPRLDVTARRIVEPSGVEARIRLQGTARDPSLSFSSTPPLDESDILALIVFNRDLNSLGGDQRSSLATLAGTTAAGFVVAPLTESLGRALALDEFEVQATSEGGAAGGIVTLGEQVGERLFVRFRQQFGAQEASEFLLEYRLANFLRLQTAVAEGDGVGRANRSLTRRVERAGVDLVFYYSY